MSRTRHRLLLTASIGLVMLAIGLVLVRSVASARAPAKTNTRPLVERMAVESIAQRGRRMETWIFPEYDTVTVQGGTAPLPTIDVEMRFCSEFSFDWGSFQVSLWKPSSESPVDVTEDFEFQEEEDPTDCEFEARAEGEVEIELGDTYLEAFVCDTPMFWCGTVLGYYTGVTDPNAAPNPAPPPSVPLVSAMSSAKGAPAGATNLKQVFLIRNRQGSQRTFNLSCLPVGTCSVNSPLAVAAMGDATVAVTHSVGSTPGQSLNLKLIATDQSDATHTGRDSTQVLVGPPVVNDTAGIDTSATRAREHCVMVAAGAGASQCGDLVLGHALPSVRILGTTRTPTLLYNSGTAHPMILLPVNVISPSSAGSIKATLTVGGAANTITFSSWSPGQARRLVVGRNVPTLPTGVYPYTIEVRWHYFTTSSLLKTVTGEVAVVNRSESPFGAGWWLAGLERLEHLSNDRKLWIGGDGSTRIYTASGGVWRAPALTRPDSIVSMGSGMLCRKLPGGACVVFDSSSGKHIATRGRLSMNGTNGWGFRTDFGYSGDRLTRISFPLASGDSARYTFAYQNSGVDSVLSSVTAPPNGSESRVVTLAASGWKITGIQDPDLTTVGFGYPVDSLRVTSRTNRENRTTTFAYDAGGKISQISVPANAAETIVTTIKSLEARGYSDGTNGASITAAGSYTMIDGPRTDVGDTTLLWLNELGAPRRIRDPLGYETILTYNNTWRGLVDTVKAPNGFVTIATYDSVGRIATQLAKNPYGSALPGDALTTYAWNAWDAITAIDPPVGPTTSFGYDPATGSRIWQQIGPDTLTRARFDYYPTGIHAGLLRSVRSFGIDADTVYYDGVRANLSAHVSPAPKRYRTTYLTDAVGRDTLIVAPVDDGQTDHQQTRITYDIMGRVETTRTSALDYFDSLQTVVVETAYDAEGRPHTVSRWSEPDQAQIGAPLQTITQYDWAGRVVATADQDFHKDTMRLDLAGNVVWSQTPRGHQITMRYDALGRLIERVVPGVVYDREIYTEIVGYGFPQYDIAFPLHPNNNRGLLIGPEVTRFWYDHAGQIRRAINNDAEIDRTYYPNGQLHTDTLRIWSGDRTALSKYGMRHAYDLAGRPTSFAYPVSGNQALYTYDADMGLLERVTAPDGDKFDFTWDPGGRLRGTSVTPAAGSQRTFFDSLYYDSQGNLAGREKHRTSAANQTGKSGDRTETYTYDAQGRRTSVAVLAAAPFDAYVDYTYSGLGALVRASTSSGLETSVSEWHSDALGNRYITVGEDLERNNAGSLPLHKRHTYVQGRLSAVTADQPTGILGPGTWPENTNYDYDAAGNLVVEDWDLYRFHPEDPPDWEELARIRTRSYYGADQKVRFVQRYDGTYDSPYLEDRKRTGTFEEYRYDPLGRRVMAIVLADSPLLCNQAGCADYEDVFVWNGDHLVYEWYRNNQNVYVHGLGIDQPLKIRDMIPSANYQGVYDLGHKSTGEEITANYPGNYLGSFMEEGKRRLTGLYASLLQGGLDQTGYAYRRNRYYDPQTGRFTQEDPIGLAGGLSLYGFAGGDPVNGWDPFGLKVCFKGMSDDPAVYAEEVQQAKLAAEEATGTIIQIDEKNGCITSVESVFGELTELGRRLKTMAINDFYDFGHGVRLERNFVVLYLGDRTVSGGEGGGGPIFGVATIGPGGAWYSTGSAWGVCDGGRATVSAAALFVHEVLGHLWRGRNNQNSLDESLASQDQNIYHSWKGEKLRCAYP